MTPALTDRSGPTFLSIPELGALYRSGAVSPVDITRACLERVRAHDHALNAFITVMEDAALAQARQAERELRSGLDRGPLHGVPVGVKDLVDTAGVPTTCGSRILAGHVPTHDAPLVTHLHAAGAVIVGKTNCSEFAMGVPHPDYGQVNNPFAPARTAGASSGGSAAAVAAGLCFAAVGTDTGGSIRIPASYCGLAGLKPTYGLVALQGVFPLSWSLDHAGPLARSSRDAALLLGAMTGQPFETPEAVPLAGRRFGLIQPPGPETQPGVAARLDTACRALEAAGATLEAVELPALQQADAALLSVLLPEAAAIHARWVRERPGDYAAVTRQQLQAGFLVPAITHVQAQQFRRLLTAQMLELLNRFDALLSISVPWVAPAEDPVLTGDEGLGEGSRSGPHNLTGLPALSIPAGTGEHDLPVGLQLVTRPHTDAFCLALGHALETLLAPDAG